MNKMLNDQRGVTFLGWCIILAIIGFFVLITLRLFPIYNEKLIVSGAMESVASRSGVDKMPNSEVIKNFLRTVQVGGSRTFNDTTVKDYLKIEKPKSKNGARVMTVTFEIRNKFMDDIDFVMNFNKSVELTGKPSGG